MSRTWRLPIAPANRRITVFFIAICIVLSLATGRAILLQGVDASANAKAAAENLTRSQTLKAERGVITDRNGQNLAETQPAFDVVVDPTAIATNGKDPASMTDEDKAKAEQGPSEMAKILVRYIGGKQSDYEESLSKQLNDDGTPNRYEVLGRKVSAVVYHEMSKTLSEEGWYGIYAQPNPVRYYPNGELAANVIGFVNSEGEGAGGIEYAANDSLQGVDGKQTYQSSRYGTIPLGDTTLVEPVNGSSYQLTIDAEMQWMAQNELANAVAKHEAKTGTAVVMSVKTGEILALANVPTFDANKPSDANPDDLGNRAVTDAYEPGSVQKVLTFAALLDAGLIEPDTAVEVPGEIASGDGKVRDAWTHGTDYMTARGVLARSSNVGTVELARRMGKEQFVDYLQRFGFGAKTGIELPGEADQMGNLPGADMPDYTRDQVSFGQGLSVTAIQEAAAIAAVTNGGVYHQPTIVKSITDSDGNRTTPDVPEPERVISQQASAKLLNMMEASVASPELGTVDAKTIPGYRMAGKSGTAQRVGASGAYDGGHTGSYVAVAPVEDPEILVYVVVDQPVRGYYGAVVAFPAASELMRQALPRYGVAPRSDIGEYTDPLGYQP